MSIPEPKSPWKRQRILKREDIPLQEQILEKAMEYEDKEERALFILAYLTGGRISEIVRCKYLYKNIYATEEAQDKYGRTITRIKRNGRGTPIILRREKILLNYPGIIKKNLVYAKKKGKNILIISMQNRKNKQFLRKNIPVPIDREQAFISLLREHTDRLHREGYLFCFGKRKAQNIINKSGYNAHYLRSCRLSHLVVNYQFGAYELVKFAGWQNASPASRYIRLGINDLIDKY